MLYNYLPSTGVKVSKVSLGAMTFGGQTDEKESIDIIDFAISEGVNFIDTARLYTDGRSEEIVGKALKKHIRRKIILASKVRYAENGGLTQRNIKRQIDRSLKALQTDFLDIYYMHGPDRHTPFEETMYAMNDLIKAGRIRYIGVSNFAAWEIDNLLWIADKRNLSGPVITENIYNLITRRIEDELLACLNHHKLGLVIYNPLAGGLLTGKHSIEEITSNTRFTEDPMYVDRYWNSDSFNALKELSEAAGDYGMNLLELALSWCISRPYVDSVIIGASKLSQIQQNIQIIHKFENIPFSEDLDKLCDSVWRKLTGSSSNYHSHFEDFTVPETDDE